MTVLALGSTVLPLPHSTNLPSTVPSSGSAGYSREAGRTGTRTPGALDPTAVMDMDTDLDAEAEDMGLAVDLVGDTPAAVRMPTLLTPLTTRRSLPSTSQTTRSRLP